MRLDDQLASRTVARVTCLERNLMNKANWACNFNLSWSSCSRRRRSIFTELTVRSCNEIPSSLREIPFDREPKEFPSYFTFSRSTLAANYIRRGQCLDPILQHSVLRLESSVKKFTMRRASEKRNDRRREPVYACADIIFSSFHRHLLATIMQILYRQ